MGDQDRSNSATAGGGWLDDTIRRFGFLSAIREVQHVKRTCRECLQLYRRIEKENGSTAAERYAYVVAKRTGSDLNGVKSIIRRVEESFGEWPERAPREFSRRGPISCHHRMPQGIGDGERRPCRSIGGRCQVDSGKTLGTGGCRVRPSKTHRRSLGATLRCRIRLPLGDA